MRRETLRCEYVKCGKRSCRSCPHGPYWYAYWREGPKVRKRYIGKGDPRDQGEPREQPAADPFDAIFDDRQATAALAWRILELPYGAVELLGRRYRELCRLQHPDRNPTADPRVFQRTQCAYQYLSKLHS